MPLQISEISKQKCETELTLTHNAFVEPISKWSSYSPGAAKIFSTDRS